MRRCRSASSYPSTPTSGGQYLYYRGSDDEGHLERYLGRTGLHGLYKQATCGDAMNHKRPGMLDQRGRAKYSVGTIQASPAAMTGYAYRRRIDRRLKPRCRPPREVRTPTKRSDDPSHTLYEEPANGNICIIRLFAVLVCSTPHFKTRREDDDVSSTSSPALARRSMPTRSVTRTAHRARVVS